MNCGVQLLLSLSVMVRSPVALEMNQVQSLYVQAPSVSSDVKVWRDLSHRWSRIPSSLGSKLVGAFYLL